MANPTPTPCGHARCQPWPTCQYRRDSCPGCTDLAIEVERIISAREAAARAEVAALRERIEAWTDRWNDDTLARLTIDQRVPIRHARDDLRAALTTRGDQ